MSPHRIEIALRPDILLVCMAAFCALTVPIGPADASTASMEAQQIPLGLIPDVSSLDRYPASAVSLKPGLYGDPEGSTIQNHAGIFNLGGARAGVIYSPRPECCSPGASRREVGAFLALPLGGVRLGAAVRGSEEDSQWSDDLLSRELHLGYWWGTFDAGVALGRRSYIEAAVSIGGLSRTQGQSTTMSPAPDSTVTHFFRIEPEADASYTIETRWKTGLRRGMTGYGLLGYRLEDESTRRHDFNDGWHGYVYDEQNDQLLEREIVTAALAVRRDGPAAARVTVGLSARYAETREDFLSSRTHENPYWTRARVFAGRVHLFVGVSREMNSWLTLFGGIAGRYEGEHEKVWSENPDETEDSEARSTGSDVSAGLRVHSKRFYIDAVVTDSFSSSNPFSTLSLGYRF